MRIGDDDVDLIAWLQNRSAVQQSPFHGNAGAEARLRTCEKRPKTRFFWLKLWSIFTS